MSDSEVWSVLFWVALVVAVMCFGGWLLAHGDYFPEGTQIVVALSDGSETVIDRVYRGDYSFCTGGIVTLWAEDGRHTWPQRRIREYRVVLPKPEEKPR